MSLSAACAIGALILHSAPLAPEAGRSETVVETQRMAGPDYAAGPLSEVRAELAGARSVNLFTACPSLLDEAPGYLRPADDDDRRDAAQHALRSANPPLRYVTVHLIGAPVLRAGGRRATVLMTYDCPGLCGGAVAYRFRLGRRGWRMDGQPRPLWVS